VPGRRTPAPLDVFSHTKVMTDWADTAQQLLSRDAAASFPLML
jgi:hypothetical protein